MARPRKTKVGTTLRVGVCAKCGADDVVVYAHHVTPVVRRGGALGTVDLCGPCHDDTHGIPRRLDIATLTREGLAAAKAKGIKLGRPAENVGEAAERATELRRQGLPWATIAKTLNAEGYTTARGGIFHPATVGRMIDRTDPTANPEGGYR